MEKENLPVTFWWAPTGRQRPRDCQQRLQVVVRPWSGFQSSLRWFAWLFVWKNPLFTLEKQGFRPIETHFIGLLEDHSESCGPRFPLQRARRAATTAAERVRKGKSVRWQEVRSIKRNLWQDFALCCLDPLVFRDI